jgi:hypothetical protein
LTGDDPENALLPRGSRLLEIAVSAPSSTRLALLLGALALLAGLAVAAATLRSTYW